MAAMMVPMCQLRMLPTFDAREGAAGTYLNERWDHAGSRIVSTDPNLPWGRTRAKERLLAKKQDYCHDVGSAFDHRGALAWTQLRHQRQSQQYESAPPLGNKTSPESTLALHSKMRLSNSARAPLADTPMYRHKSWICLYSPHFNCSANNGADKAIKLSKPTELGSVALVEERVCICDMATAI